jgi:ribonuclease E
MANMTQVAERATQIPSSEDLERVEQFTREPFRDFELTPGTARWRAFDAALAEIEAGHEVPSVEWRQQYSLMLGLERLLLDDEPKLVDGTVLSAHQVDALSGTLTALIAEAERQNGNGTTVPVEEEFDEDEEPDDELEDDDDWPADAGANGSGGLEEGAKDEQIPA